MADKSCKDKLDEYISRAYDYIVQVLEVQGRYMSDDDMYNGYKSVFPIRLQLSKPCFIAVYAEIKTLCHDRNLLEKGA